CATDARGSGLDSW
nr:immunoglobulin heavy chain junction region [Macaca mulatta]MOX60662.1 immunoglobulin heavy chain junction region [Macaca mulatta]MOX63583.1 immunoglobulin heavy chain junction region [Macaca mulatta]MOX67059.1 immunoglobulin heavy chain junction region [Macaca mulatta]